MTTTPAHAAGTAEHRHIWLCADDFGISSSVDIAIRDLVVRGRLNATSVLVVAPGFSRSEAHSLNTHGWRSGCISGSRRRFAL
jgi:hypothetical protein